MCGSKEDYTFNNCSWQINVQQPLIDCVCTLSWIGGLRLICFYFVQRTKVEIHAIIIVLDKVLLSVKNVESFLNSAQNHMLWILIRSALLRRF